MCLIYNQHIELIRLELVKPPNHCLHAGRYNFLSVTVKPGPLNSKRAVVVFSRLFDQLLPMGEQKNSSMALDVSEGSGLSKPCRHLHQIRPRWLGLDGCDTLFLVVSEFRIFTSQCVRQSWT